MADAKTKRASDSKDLSDKGGAKADVESEAQSHQEGKASTNGVSSQSWSTPSDIELGVVALLDDMAFCP